MTITIPTWLLITLGVPAAVVFISFAIIGFLFVLRFWNRQWYV